MRRSPAVCMSSSRLSSLLLCLLSLSTLSFAAAGDRITGAIVTDQAVALPRSLHAKAQPQYDRGPVDPSKQLSYITILTSPSPSQQRALSQLLAQQQDRTSSNYHKWLTPQQYAERFGLSANDFTKIAEWLKSQGFQMLSVGGGRNSIIFSGTAAQVQAAFGTEIHAYQINGEEHFSNSTPVMIPSALRGIITALIGLHDFREQPANRAMRSVSTRDPLRDYYDGNYIFPNFLAPDDIATIYDIAPLYKASTPIDGTGQQLAIVGQTDIYLADINDFRAGFNLSQIPFSQTPTTGSCTVDANGIVISPCTTTNFAYVLVGTDQGISPGDLGESDLDIEWSGAVARNAQIVFVNGETSGGVIDALIAVINPPSGPPLAPVVSMSYGECELFDGADLESTLQQGNVEGVTIVNSSGDVGSASCDRDPSTNRPFAGAQYGLAVSYPASSQYVTGVGGTAISLANDSYPSPSPYWSTTLGQNGGTAVSYIPEIPWNDDEELALYCHSPAHGDTFCSQGGPKAVAGWTKLTSTATASQVQSDIWISMGGGGASNCWYETAQGVCLGAGPGPTGGGFAQPAYQKGLSVTGAPAGVRWVPDVSMLASPDFPGYIFCTQLSELNENGSGSSCASGIFVAVDTYASLVGGTSASSPVFAGIITLLNQDAMLNGIPGAPGLGNINPALYSLAATKPNAFHQVTNGDNMVYCQVGLPTGFPTNVVCPSAGVFGFEASNKDSATGYNLVTGLGSVDANNLLTAWIETQAFTLAASPTTVSISQGGTAGVTTITVSDLNGFAGSVTLAASNLPTGVTASFGTNPTTSTSTLSLTASGAAAVGTSTITVTGTSGSSTATTTVSLQVAAGPSFSLSANPASVTITPTLPGKTSVITVTDAGGFTGNVTLAASGLPTGVTAAFSPNPTSGTSTLTLTASGSASAGSATVTITGTSGSLTATTTIALTVTPAPSFSLSNSGGVTLTPGITNTGTSTITVNDLNGFTGSVTLVASGLPTGVTAAFGTNPTTTTSVLTLTATGSTVPATATVTITGTSGSLNATTTVALTVNQNFALSTPTTPATVLSGETATSTFNVTATNGTTFTSAVTFACNGLPDATVTCSFSSIAAGLPSPQPVTLTINTTGPNNSGGANKLKRRADNRMPWLPLTLPLAGIVMVGFGGRKMSKHVMIGALCMVLVLLGLLVACGSSSAPAVGVSVSPSASTLFPNDAADSWPPQTATFNATVTNTTNTAVTWSVSPSTAGTITSGGVYTAPTIVAGLPGSATITATSAADTSKSASATVTITPSTVPGMYPITVTATEGTVPHTSSSTTLTVQ